MRSFFANVGALVLGAVSFALTVAVIVGFKLLTGINLFSVMWCFMIPIGALVTGLVAASGYYYGAVTLHVRPTRTVAIGMIVMAALVQVTIYYCDYMLSPTYETFLSFVSWRLSHARYERIGSHPGANGGEGIGFFGYVVAVLQLLALVAGGLAIFLNLNGKPYCAKCSKYLRKALTKRILFNGDRTTIADFQSKTDEPTPAYFEQLRQLPGGNIAALHLELLRCQRCRVEALVEQPLLMKKGELSPVSGAERTLWVPAGTTIEHLVTSVAPPPAIAGAVSG